MVNGPGEAKEADLGLACGRGGGILFKKGKLCRRIKEERIIPELIKEVKKMALEEQKCGRTIRHARKE
jgi:(E)-4-hydroxy-3-methylbut-2-enyl-diphosphate synthase